MSGVFAVLNATDERTTLLGKAKECIVRAGGSCDNMPPSAMPMTRLAIIMRIRFIFDSCLPKPGLEIRRLLPVIIAFDKVFAVQVGGYYELRLGFRIGGMAPFVLDEQ